MTPIEPGRVLAGRYRLSHRLGEGGMGSVWSAEHLELRSKVAIKLIVPRHASDATVLARFEREARAAAALRSPHVVQILDFGIDDGCAFIAMEELRGEDLAARLGREPRLTPALTATVITHVARAVGLAHEAELVHRDLKPANVFLVQNDDEIVAKVLDFGIAKVRLPPDEASGARTDTGALVGSPFYMSPEQARGRSDVDWRSDLWSLGVVAFECLVGQRPFEGTSLGDIIMTICHDPIRVPSTLGPVPAGFDGWFAKATQRDPERRFQSAKELASSLRAILTPGSNARPESPAEPAAGGERVPAVSVSSAPAADGQATLEPPPSAPAPAHTPLGVTTTGGTSGSHNPPAGVSGGPSRARKVLWPVLALLLALAGLLVRQVASRDASPSGALVPSSPAIPQSPSAAPLPSPARTIEVGPAAGSTGAPPAASQLGSAAPPDPSARGRTKRITSPRGSGPNLLDKRF